MDDGIVAGRNACLEALRSGAVIEKIYFQRGQLHGSAVKIRALAVQRGVTVKEADRVKLDHLAGMDNHQGVVAVMGGREYCSLDDILENARLKGEAPFVVLCDGIVDPHNLGAILRTAEASGAHGVIIQKDRAAGVTPSVVKASAGAALHISIAKVVNLAAAIKTLKAAGLWVFGADPKAESTLYEADFALPCALVIGAEGGGMSRLVRESCDFLVSIPMRGKVASLNASVSAGVLMYELVRARSKK